MNRIAGKPTPKRKKQVFVYLIIDTSDGQSIKVGLTNRRQVIDSREIKLLKPSGALCLKAIDQLFKAGRLNRSALKGLLVVQGPGPFTAVRTGVVLANALAFSLAIPSAGVSLDAWNQPQKYLVRLQKALSIKPKYGRPPNITYPKVSQFLS